MLVTRRKKGEVLSALKVQEYAALSNINSLRELERAYDEAYLGTDTYAAGTPKSAWEGKISVAFKYAQQIANLFGLRDYFFLLEDQGYSAWDKLLLEEKHQANFARLSLLSEVENGLVDFPFDTSLSGDDFDVDKVNINEKWLIEIEGKSMQHFMIVLQASDVAIQLAPLSHPDSDNIISFTCSRARYPENITFSFSSEFGVGLRRLTVVLANNMPIAPMSLETGPPVISPEGLERFAHRMLLGKQAFSVYQYRFELVESDTSRKINTI